MGVDASGAFDPNTDPNLVAWWALDGDATDSSGNGLHGTVVGDPEWVEGRIGEAIDLDGAGDYVDCGNPPELTIRDELTIMCWFKVESFTRTWETIMAKGDDSYRLSRGPGDGNGTHMGISGTSASPSYFDAPTIVTDNRWHHIAGVYDGTQAIIYIDGKPDRVYPSTGQINESTNSLFIGENSQATGRFLDGQVDDVRVYNRALTAEEVKSFVPPQLKAFEPSPADGAVGVMTPLLQWTAGETAMFHDVYLGTSPDLTDADLVGTRLPFTMHYHIAGFEPGVVYYWRVDEIEVDMVTIHTGDVWSLTAMPMTAWAPAPADGAEQILLEPTLSWTPGQGAVGHHLYLGSDFDAVSAGATETDVGEIAAGETSYQVTTSLEMDTVYYWRVDGTDTAGAVVAGEVWSFATIAPGPGGAIRQWWTGVSGTTLDILRGNARFPDEPSGEELVSLMEGPVNWSDNYGSRIYGWLYPPETGDYTFWIATDDQGELWLSTDADPANATLIAGVEGWVPSRDFFGTTGVPGTRQQSAPVALEAGQVYYIEALMNEGGGGDNIAVAWQGPDIPFGVIAADFIGPTSVYPVKAFAPSPADGAMDTIQSLVLSWSAGQGASLHAVYLGDDAEAVANADTSSPEYKGQQAATTYNTGPLEWGKTYYWRIDENTAPEAGKVWSFTTANFINVEDFESYDDGENRIYLTWIDGVDNGTGSYVGYEVANNGTFGETQIVHGGGQSMPLDYNNVNAPFYSETDRTFGTPQDWTVNGVDTLVLHVRGRSANDAEPLYVGLENVGGAPGIVFQPDSTVVTTAKWTAWEIPLSEFTAAGVDMTAVKKMYIGLGDREAPTPGGAGLIYIDDIWVIRSEQGE